MWSPSINEVELLVDHQVTTAGVLRHRTRGEENKVGVAEVRRLT